MGRESPLTGHISLSLKQVGVHSKSALPSSKAQSVGGVSGEERGTPGLYEPTLSWRRARPLA